MTHRNDGGDCTPDRHQLRKRLLENGYIPLPLCGKACYAPGWSTVEVDEEWLSGHRRRAALTKKGIVAGDGRRATTRAATRAKIPKGLTGVTVKRCKVAAVKLG